MNNSTAQQQRTWSTVPNTVVSTSAVPCVKNESCGATGRRWSPEPGRLLLERQKGARLLLERQKTHTHTHTHTVMHFVQVGRGVFDMLDKTKIFERRR